MSPIVLGELILRLCEVLLLTILLLHLMLWKVAILGTGCILTIPYYMVILAHSSRFGAVDDISHSSQSIKSWWERKSMKKRWLEDDDLLFGILSFQLSGGVASKM